MSVVIYDKDGNKSLCAPESLHVQLNAGFTLEKPGKEKVEKKTETVKAEKPKASGSGEVSKFDRDAAIAKIKEAGGKVRSNASDAKIKEMIEALEGK